MKTGKNKSKVPMSVEDRELLSLVASTLSGKPLFPGQLEEARRVLKNAKFKLA